MIDLQREFKRLQWKLGRRFNPVVLEFRLKTDQDIRQLFTETATAMRQEIPKVTQDTAEASLKAVILGGADHRKGKPLSDTLINLRDNYQSNPPRDIVAAMLRSVEI